MSDSSELLDLLYEYRRLTDPLTPNLLARMSDEEKEELALKVVTTVENISMLAEKIEDALNN